MIRVIDRYLLREVLMAWAAVSLVMLLVVIGAFIADALGDVARGLIPPGIMFSQMGLKSLQALSLLLPLSLFFGVLIAFGRMYRDSEMVVLSACGISLNGILKALLPMALGGVLALALFSFFIGPWAARTTENLRAEAARSMLVAGIKPGRFRELPGSDAVIYVESVSADGRELANIFVHRARPDPGTSGVKDDIVGASTGRQYRDPNTGKRYLVLEDGYRVISRAGQADTQMMEFGSSELEIPVQEEERAGTLTLEAMPSREIYRSDEPSDVAEWHWRLAPPITALVLMVLAVPLSRVAPREGRYGRLLIGILTYVVYANLLGVGRSWLEQGRAPHWLGLWWVHALFLAVAVVWLWRLRGHRRSARMVRS